MWKKKEYLKEKKNLKIHFSFCMDCCSKFLNNPNTVNFKLFMLLYVYYNKTFNFKL